MEKETCSRLAELFAEYFHADPKKVRSELRELADMPEKAEELLRKLEFLKKRGLLRATEEEEGHILSCPVMYCSYENLVFAAQVPELLSFTAEQTEEYRGRALYWARYTDIRGRVQPLLEQLCGEEAAREILCGLYISSYTTVGEEAIVNICEKLLSYPDPRNVRGEYVKTRWYELFSVYSDPEAALDLLDERFVTDRVLDILAGIEYNWPGLVYARVQKDPFERGFCEKILDEIVLQNREFLK